MTEKRFNNVGSYLYAGNEPIGSYNDVTIHQNICDLLNELNNENTRIKQTIREAYENERTHIGRNVLKQLIQSLE